MVRLCLNGIVKNEAARIERMLDSVGQFINCVILVDTGSTDDTKEKIARWCAAQKIPCHLPDVPFHNWSQARNAALAHARTYYVNACDKTGTEPFDYLLLCDADMEIKVADRSVFDGLTGPSYEVFQYAGSCHYKNTRLVKVDQPGEYRGVTHEYFDIPTGGTLPDSSVFFIDHADGANRPEKFKRDIKLLRAGLKDEPHNERYMFYLANSYRDAGKPDQAATWYKRRVDAGGWAEEQWQAQRYYAHCLRDMGDMDGFIAATLKAYQMRPSRAESVYDLAHHYREKGDNALGAMFAEATCAIPYSHDALFVDDMVHTVGGLEELSICGFYQDNTRAAGFRATDKLSLMKTPYVNARELARNNMFHYLRPLIEYCPSFKWQKVEWTPPFDGWTCMNPSITRHGSALVMNMRTVNYRMDDRGRYLIKDVYDDGTTGCNATAANPIHTRNWLLTLQRTVTPGDGVTGYTVARADEIMNPAGFPCEFPLVIGFEDMRLFQWNNDLWASATVRQYQKSGECVQFRARIDQKDGDFPRLVDAVPMLRQPQATEKNWAPWPRFGGRLCFMYQQGHVVDELGADVIKHNNPMYMTDLRGGSQIIPFSVGWLSLVHEARPLPTEPYKRFYWHRFVYYDWNGAVKRISAPFVLNDRTIEFVAGMCSEGDKLLISYGYKDEEARLASVSYDDVRELLGIQ